MADSIKGKIYSIFPVQEIPREDKAPLKKREFILEVTNERGYKDFIPFELVKEEKVAILNLFSVGSEVEVFYNMRGRAYTVKKEGPMQGQERAFLTLSAWAVKDATPSNFKPVNNSSEISNNNDEDLPF